MTVPPKVPTTAGTASPYVLELVGATRSFGQQTVLRNITFGVKPGETLALIGESGCGKSVTTKLLAGHLFPSSGSVRWDGADMAELSRREFRARRLRFGYLFQGAALFDSLDVYENVVFGLRENTRMREPELRNIAKQRLQEVGLPWTAARKRPSELSGGMKKRVALARALAMSPEVMFYDEPTTGLDPIMSDVINQLILETRSRQTVTSIVVTHDMLTVKRVADRVIMLYPTARLAADEPQIVFEGTPAEAFASTDPRVHDFVYGEASARQKELAA